MYINEKGIIMLYRFRVLCVGMGDSEPGVTVRSLDSAKPTKHQSHRSQPLGSCT